MTASVRVSGSGGGTLEGADFGPGHCPLDFGLGIGVFGFGGVVGALLDIAACLRFCARSSNSFCLASKGDPLGFLLASASGAAVLLLEPPT